MSAASQASGKQRGDAEARSGGKARSTERAEPVEVTLEHARWRHLGWAITGVLLGSLLILHLGTVGKMIGVLLVGVAVYHGYAFVRTLTEPAGTIVVNAERVQLPLGLCRGSFETFATADIRHAFLLRRAVPWTTTAPTLVIEVDERAFVYPRDWFVTEADQRRIARAIRLYQERPTGS